MKWRLFFREQLVEYQCSSDYLKLNKIMANSSQWIQYKKLRFIFLDELIQITGVVVGEEKEKMRYLYYKLNFHRFINERLMGKHLLTLISGLQEARTFKVQVCSERIHHLCEHPNFTVAVLAQQLAMEQSTQLYSYYVQAKGGGYRWENKLSYLIFQNSFNINHSIKFRNY